LQKVKKTKEVALVTGATSGLGAAIAARLAKEGFLVYGTGRNPSANGEAEHSGVRYLSMDVRSDEAVNGVIADLVHREGRIDLLVACAGMGIAGAVEDTKVADIALQMDVNFLGTVRTVKACIAPMRKQGKGKIVIVGSLAGRTGMPYQAFYSSSKFALEGFVESLRYELRPFNIGVCIVEPGDFRTGFTAARRKTDVVSDAYKTSFSRTIAIQEHDEQNGAFPMRAAAAISALVGRSSLPVRVSVGPLFQRAAVFVKRLVPATFFEFVYRKYYKMN
jgi:NAD(P)-dependent dehydrogenase (short-subunit alcohol dehydrogenase family)